MKIKAAGSSETSEFTKLKSVKSHTLNLKIEAVGSFEMSMLF
jgi:hypothetical protein